MSKRLRLQLLIVAACVLLSTGNALAARIKFHYRRVDQAGNTTLVPAGNCGGAGERISWLGAVREPYNNQPRPTHLVTFRHPYTGGTISVPLSFPEGTPRIEYIRDRIRYNYGSYTVEAQFLPDGSVDMVYDSGLSRGP